MECACLQYAVPSMGSGVPRAAMMLTENICQVHGAILEEHF
jgi:hypothetical protein